MLTLMGDLEYRPEHLLPLLALVRGILCVFHLIGKFEERVLQIGKSVGWGFSVARVRARRWHSCWLSGRYDGLEEGWPRKFSTGLVSAVWKISLR